MIGLRARLYKTASWLSLYFLLPQVLSAAVAIQKELTLDAYLNGSDPVVHSFARAVLVDSVTRERIYDKQVILGHRVADVTVHFYVFTARIVSDIGYANSTTRDMGGIPEHCYTADLAAHVNAENLHESLTVSSVKCIPHLSEPPGGDIPEENCPILLDLEMDGFHLSGPDPAVSFDINADGTADSIAWTKAGEDDAFLCLDRNQNGAIDDGSELFGYAAPLLSGEPAKIGYRALAELDAPRLGGNHDGKIDAQDAAFSELCVWLDQDRNGLSQAGELFRLDQVGVVTLEYAYRETQLSDSFGNLFRYISRTEMRTPAGALRLWPTFDVIFTEP